MIKNRKEIKKYPQKFKQIEEMWINYVLGVPFQLHINNNKNYPQIQLMKNKISPTLVE
jgi:hypothetical protein